MCSFIDVPCHLWQMIEPFWFWIQISFWVVVGLVVLFALSQIKNIAGYPGVVAVVGLVGVAVGWIWRGSKDEPVETEHLSKDSVDVIPPLSKKRGGNRYDPSANGDKGGWVKK